MAACLLSRSMLKRSRLSWSFVAAGLGIALVPASYKDMNADGVKYLALTPKKHIEGLPLSAMWHQEITISMYDPCWNTFQQHRRADP
ncbi:hypothetical protein LNP25_20720 [Klebsiella variicola subsp. variicola]|nr:hypothetical protein [Klebsiella variicola subsp. variicola]